MSRLQKVEGERALYRDPGGGVYHIRVFFEGKDTYRSLQTTRLREAVQRMDARRTAKAAANLGRALELDSVGCVERQSNPLVFWAGSFVARSSQPAMGMLVARASLPAQNPARLSLSLESNLE